MKFQFNNTIVIFITVTAISSLLLTSFILSNNIANASIMPNSSSSSLNGIISSLILDIPLSNNNNSLPFNITNTQKFILAGDWYIKFENISSSNNNSNLEQVTDFSVDFMAISKDGKGAHKHQISNFNQIVIADSNTTENSNTKSSFNVFTHNGNAHILGTVDVGINDKKIWENVKINIKIFDGKTIEILLDDENVDYHFGKGQAIYGLVTFW